MFLDQPAVFRVTVQIDHADSFGRMFRTRA